MLFFNNEMNLKILLIYCDLLNVYRSFYNVLFFCFAYKNNLYFNFNEVLSYQVGLKVFLV
jgi:hypothetical protein